MPPSPAEFASLGHFGLLGMHERADLIGAELKISSNPGKGTQITLTVNLEDR
jgi:signal transduction histidine kinase